MTPLPDIRIRRTGYVALVQRRLDKATVTGSFVDWLAALAVRSGDLTPPSLRPLSR